MKVNAQQGDSPNDLTEAAQLLVSAPMVVDVDQLLEQLPVETTAIADLLSTKQRRNRARNMRSCLKDKAHRQLDKNQQDKSAFTWIRKTLGDLLKDDINSKGSAPSPLDMNYGEGTSQLNTPIIPFTPRSSTLVATNRDVTNVKTQLHPTDRGELIQVIDLSDSIARKRRRETPDCDPVVDEAILIDTQEGEPSTKRQRTFTDESLLENNVTNAIPMTEARNIFAMGISKE